MVRPVLTLPPITPTRWELSLPGYPVITGEFRSASYPELLGSLPCESRWNLYFDNMTDAQTAALLLPSRASAGGVWPLTPLPEQIAAGVNSADFQKRLTGTSWTIEGARMSQARQVGRYDVVIELIHELGFDSVYGPTLRVIYLGPNPLLIGTPGTVSLGASVQSLDPFLPVLALAGPVLATAVPGGLRPLLEQPQFLDPFLPALESVGPAIAVGNGGGPVVAAVVP